MLNAAFNTFLWISGVVLLLALAGLLVAINPPAAFVAGGVGAFVALMSSRKEKHSP